MKVDKNKNIILSIVVPVYNSHESLNELMKRIEKISKELVGNEYEIIFVDDGSTDNSWSLLSKMADKNEYITSVTLSRNFGQHNALYCGFSLAKGDYVVTIDDDLQIPPEEIEKLYSKALRGYDVVYGIFDHKRHSYLRKIGSKIVQIIYQKTFNIDTPITSFRIIKKSIYKKMLGYDKSFTFIDGLISWYTNSITGVEVMHTHRKYGRSGYSLKTLLVLALNMVTNFSITPLQIASMLGVIFAFIGFALGLFMMFKKLILGIPVSGFTSLFVSITILSGVQLITVGVLGEYIGRIHINVSNRPQYVIKEIVGPNNEQNKEE